MVLKRGFNLQKLSMWIAMNRALWKHTVKINLQNGTKIAVQSFFSIINIEKEVFEL